MTPHNVDVISTSTVYSENVKDYVPVVVNGLKEPACYSVVATGQVNLIWLPAVSLIVNIVAVDV